MKKYMCGVFCIALLTACEQKETSVTNPPEEKKETKETNTTIVNPSPAASKKVEKTEINIGVSPSPTP